MPSVSQAQQKLMGMALAVRRGELKRSEVDQEVLDIVDGDMTDKQIRDFAKTKRKSLPEYVKESLYIYKADKSLQISEGLFDDEEELLDKKLSSTIINWFKDSANAHVDPRHLEILDSGAVKLNSKVIIEWHRPLPDWIVLDKKSWEENATNAIWFPIKSQDDLNNIPGKISEILMTKVLKNITINADNSIDIGDLNDYKNITLIGNKEPLKLNLYNIKTNTPEKLLEFNYSNTPRVHLFTNIGDEIFNNYNQYENILNELVRRKVVIISYYIGLGRAPRMAVFMKKGSRRYNTNKIATDVSKGEWVIFDKYTHKFIIAPSLFH